MDQPFIAMIMAWAANFNPKYWGYCNGQLLQVSQNQALYSLIGTIYGGNGSTTFALPDLRGRVPVGAGQSPGGSVYTLGSKGGTEQVALTQNEMPQHTHPSSAGSLTVTPVYSSGTASRNTPQNGDTIGVVNDGKRDPILYPAYTGNGQTPGAPASVSGSVEVGASGGSMPHSNMQPFQVINWVIALNGIYPPRD